MKKIIVLLIGLMMFSSVGVVFADDIVNDDNGRQVLSKEEKREKITSLFNEHNPDGLADFNAVIAEHKLFHENARLEREQYKEEALVEREEIKALVMSGELTKEEVEAMISEKKTERKNMFTEIKAILEMKQADNEANKADIAAIRTSLRTELKEEIVDSGEIASLLDELVDLFEKHLEIDYYYYDKVHELR